MYDKVIGALEISGVIVCAVAIFGVFAVCEHVSYTKKPSEEPTVKVYVEDYTYDGDDSTLTYSEAVKTYFNGDTLRTAMFLTENGNVIEVTNLDKVVSTDEEKPYVTYKGYAEGTTWHDKDAQHSINATLHLPKGMHRKVNTVSSSE